MLCSKLTASHLQLVANNFLYFSFCYSAGHLLCETLRAMGSHLPIRRIYCPFKSASSKYFPAYILRDKLRLVACGLYQATYLKLL
jgi:hypothetical protein